MRRGVRGGLAATLTAIALAGGVSGTASAAVTWTMQAVPRPSPANAAWLTSVSCPASGFCMAANGYGAFSSGGFLVPAVEIWNGSSWSPQALPLPSGVNTGGVTAVSCASATSCVAVGSYPRYMQPAAVLAEIWNGSSWKPETLPEPGVTLHAISCPSATRCVAAGQGGTTGAVAELWNGSTWRAQDLPGPAAAAEGGLLYGVSCPVTTSCTAVGAWINNQASGTPLIERWNVKRWKDSSGPLPAGGTGGGLSAVSCVSPSACFAVGGYSASGVAELPLAEHLSHRTWAASVPPPPPGATYSGLSGISCTTVTGGVRCTAVGTFSSATKKSEAMAEHWNGHAWAYQQTAAPVYRKSLAAVACVPGGACEAVGQQTLVTSSYVQPLAEQN